MKTKLIIITFIALSISVFSSAAYAGDYDCQSKCLGDHEHLKNISCIHKIRKVGSEYLYKTLFDYEEEDANNYESISHSEGERFLIMSEHIESNKLAGVMAYIIDKTTLSFVVSSTFILDDFLGDEKVFPSDFTNSATGRCKIIQ